MKALRQICFFQISSLGCFEQYKQGSRHQQPVYQLACTVLDTPVCDNDTIFFYRKLPYWHRNHGNHIPFAHFIHNVSKQVYTPGLKLKILNKCGMKCPSLLIDWLVTMAITMCLEGVHNRIKIHTFLFCTFLNHIVPSWLTSQKEPLQSNSTEKLS